MPSECVVINASPLITLCKSNQEWLLPQLFREIVVPEAVWQEVAAGDPDDVAAKKLMTLSWLIRDSTVELEPMVQAWDLGAGESAVISYALSYTDFTVVIDDAAARNCARSMSVPAIGTVGLIVLAKRRGLIAQITPGLTALQDAGLWLSTVLVAQLKEQEGES